MAIENDDHLDREYDIVVRCHDALHAIPRRKKAKSLQKISHTWLRQVKAGDESNQLDDPYARGREAARKNAEQMIVACKTERLDLLTAVQKRYERKYNKHRVSYGLDAEAIKNDAAKAARSKAITAVEKLSKLASDSETKFECWSKAISECESALEQIVSVISTYTSRIREWEKLIIDRRRLYLAIFAFWGSLFLSILSLSYQIGSDWWLSKGVFADNSGRISSPPTATPKG